MNDPQMYALGMMHAVALCLFVWLCTPRDKPRK
jgi:hypothetical protein